MLRKFNNNFRNYRAWLHEGGMSAWKRHKCMRRLECPGKGMSVEEG